MPRYFIATTLISNTPVPGSAFGNSNGVSDSLYLIEQDLSKDSNAREVIDIANSDINRLTNRVRQLRQACHPDQEQRRCLSLASVIENVNVLILPQLPDRHITRTAGCFRGYIEGWRSFDLDAAPYRENAEREMERLGKILIIDDDDNLRATFGLVLRRSGYEVMEAENALAALDRLLEDAYDMAFLDLRMPGMDGGTLLVKLRGLYPEMPVIILTAYASVESTLHAAKRGARDYLVKPLSPVDILEWVRQYLADAQPEGRDEDFVPAALKAVTESFLPGFQHQNERFTQMGDALLDRWLNTLTIEARVTELPDVGAVYLSVLMKHAPQAVSYETLVLEAQGLHLEKGEARDLARWHVQGLRAVVDVEQNNGIRIVPIRNFGYRFVPLFH